MRPLRTELGADVALLQARSGSVSAGAEASSVCSYHTVEEAVVPPAWYRKAGPDQSLAAAGARVARDRSLTQRAWARAHRRSHRPARRRPRRVPGRAGASGRKGPGNSADRSGRASPGAEPGAGRLRRGGARPRRRRRGGGYGLAEALAAAWEAGDDALACVGGPLQAVFPTGRPGWLSDDLLDAFATRDLGHEPAVVDARDRTFHGANVAFRTTAAPGRLRLLAGSRTQRRARLVQRGARGPARACPARADGRRTVPGAAAERVVDRDARRRVVLRRRLGYGARRALIGAPVPARSPTRASQPRCSSRRARSRR
jgi:hypothetical protein